MTMQKLFELGSSLSPTAITKPPKGMAKEEIKYHIATLQYRCLICNTMVNKTYHIHKTLLKQATNNKGKTICSG